MTTDQITPKAIPESHRDLVEQPIIASFGTVLSDGTPQVTPLWFSYEDGYFYVNTAVGRLKDKAVRANPYVALAFVDPQNGYRYMAIRGPVVEINEEAGRAHINFLAKRYTGADEYPGPADEPRVRYKIAPEHVTTMG